MELKAGYKQTEVGVIPEDWDVKTLEMVSDHITSGSRGWAAFYSKTGAIFIRSQNIKSGRLDISDFQFVSPPSGSEGTRTKVNKNDLLITITGNSVGNVALVNQNFDEAYISQHVGLVRFKISENGEYISRYLSPGSPGNGQIVGSQSGQSKPGLTLKNVENFRVAFPNSDVEQRAIATALSDTDALIESLEQLIAKKRLIKQGTMQELLTGKRRLPGFSGEWEVKRLGEIADIRSGGTPSTMQSQFWDGGVLWCTPTDITALNGFKYLSKTTRSISVEGLRASSAEIIPRNSIVMTSRATIGECAINVVPLTTNQGFKNFIPFEMVDVEFLYYLLSTHRSGFISLCSGSTFLEIGKTQLSAYQVQMPKTKSEQSAIATVLSDLDTELTALESQLEKTRAIKQGMMQSLLTGRIRLLG